MNNNYQNIHSLCDVLSIDGIKIAAVENNIEKVLPVWISKIESKILKEELDHYLFDIRSHQMELKNQNQTNDDISHEHNIRIVKAYIDEANEKLNACADTKIADAYMIYAIQAINHYKINIYGTLAAYADFLGQQKKAEMFHKAMLDEKVADMRLSNIAEKNVNVVAKTGS